MVNVSGLISIVIPAYNRANLLGETIDSILVQTYTHWEALIVDDGSTDSTDTLMKSYTKNDARIKYFKRPQEFPKGGNVCRNIGLERAKGNFIVFFDSDDLMTPDHLEVKIAPFLTQDVDFTITKTKYFNKPPHKLEHEYNLERFPITLENYLSQHINWLTLDICVRASVVKTIRFNESLKAGQEFNFYSKLLAHTTNGIFIPTIVSLRRYHEGSIQSRLKSKNDKRYSSFLSKWNTYLDIESYMSNQEKKALLFNCLKIVIQLKEVPKRNTKSLAMAVLKVFRIKGLYFIGYLFLKPFNKGYFFIRQLYKMGMPDFVEKTDDSLV